MLVLMCHMVQASAMHCWSCAQALCQGSAVGADVLCHVQLWLASLVLGLSKSVVASVAVLVQCNSSFSFGTYMIMMMARAQVYCKWKGPEQCRVPCIALNIKL